jgi:hypothetical protein
MKRLRGRLTYANVISSIALFLVLAGGTAFAAKEALLPKNSVGVRQLKRGAVTPAKLSKAAKLGLQGGSGPQGGPGVQGTTGATGAPGREGPQGPVGATGAATGSGTVAPLLIDASAPEQPLPTTSTPLALDGQTSWTASEEQPGLLVAEAEMTIASDGLGGSEFCGGTIEVLDNGQVAAIVKINVNFMTPNNLTPTAYRLGSVPRGFGLTDPTETQTITADYTPYGTECAAGAELDGVRVIVEPLS